MNKCYSCKFRRSIPGDAHSRCGHPAVENFDGMEVFLIMGMLGMRSTVQIPGINVVGNKHGIEGGWFNWPVNFDPIWLEECDGFEEK